MSKHLTAEVRNTIAQYQRNKNMRLSSLNTTPEFWNRQPSEPQNSTWIVKSAYFLYSEGGVHRECISLQHRWHTEVDEKSCSCTILWKDKKERKQLIDQLICDPSAAAQNSSVIIDYYASEDLVNNWPRDLRSNPRNPNNPHNDEAIAVANQRRRGNYLYYPISGISTTWAQSYYGSFADIIDPAQEKLNKQAEHKARSLFLSHLTREQKNEFESKRTFLVRLPKTKKRYLFTQGSSMNIHEVDRNRTYLVKYCVQVRASVPVFDHMLAQLLLLRSDEALFIQKANKWSVPQSIVAGVPITTNAWVTDIWATSPVITTPVTANSSIYFTAEYPGMSTVRIVVEDTSSSGSTITVNQDGN